MQSELAQKPNLHAGNKFSFHLNTLLLDHFAQWMNGSQITIEQRNKHRGQPNRLALAQGDLLVQRGGKHREPVQMQRAQLYVLECCALPRNEVHIHSHFDVHGVYRRDVDIGDLNRSHIRQHGCGLGPRRFRQWSQ